MKMKIPLLEKLLDTAKAAPRGKFIVFNAHLKKEERFQIGDLHSHLKNPEE